MREVDNARGGADGEHGTLQNAGEMIAQAEVGQQGDDWVIHITKLN